MSVPGVGRVPAHALVLGWPLPALVLAAALGGVGTAATAYILASPFDAAAFGGLTVSAVLAAGFAIRAGLALAVIAMSFGLMVPM
jgi:hypothetical protein